MNPYINQTRHSAQWSIVASIAMILAGLLAIIAPAVSGVFLAMLVAWVLIFSGVAHFIYAWHTHTGSYMGMSGFMHGTGSIWWEVMTGVIYVATGIFMLAHPVMALTTLTLLLGVYLAVEAFFEFALSFHFRHFKGSGWLLFDAIITTILAVLIFQNWPQSSEWVIGTLVGFSILFSGASRLALAVSVHLAARILPG